MKVRDDCLRCEHCIAQLLWEAYAKHGRWGKSAYNFLYVDEVYSSQHSISFNNYRQARAYEVDFGDNKAKLCLPTSLGDEVLIFPGPEGRDAVVFLFIEKNAKSTKMMATDKWMEKLHAYTPTKNVDSK
eukprot:scaffold622727_cov41-Prasinocladus_malaysianus.AAC.2